MIFLIHRFLHLQTVHLIKFKTPLAQAFRFALIIRTEDSPTYIQEF